MIVSTSEGEHLAPVLKAIELGKAVLVEKPIALNMRTPTASSRRRSDGANLRVGYSRRYKDRYLIAKEQIIQGRVGKIIGGAARVFNSRSQALAMMKRNPDATPVVDALTYYVDLMNWLLEGRTLAEVFARGQTGVLKAAGHDVDDVNWPSSPTPTARWSISASATRCRKNIRRSATPRASRFSAPRA